MKRGTEEPPRARPVSSSLVLYSVGVVALFAAIGVLFYYVLVSLSAFPLSLDLLVRVAIVLALGVGVIYVINALLRTVVGRAWGARRAGQTSAIFRMVGYVVLAVALLSVVGVSSLALLAGGTFIGLIVGLAGQQVLSNVFAGVVILVVGPYRIGERVTVSTWQYGLVIPAYPPKFYSQDTLVPGYTGVVRDVGIFYTTIATDDGTPLRVPNSIMIQAAVISHEIDRRPVRTKCEVTTFSPDPQVVIDRLRQAVQHNEWVVERDSVSVTVNQATSAAYVVAIDAVCRGAYEEPARSSILITAIRTIRELTAPKPARAP